MSSGRVIRTVTLTCNPSYLYQQIKSPSTRLAVGETKDSCISNFHFLNIFRNPLPARTIAGAEGFENVCIVHEDLGNARPVAVCQARFQGSWEALVCGLWMFFFGHCAREHSLKSGTPRCVRKEEPCLCGDDSEKTPVSWEESEARDLELVV